MLFSASVYVASGAWWYVDGDFSEVTSFQFAAITEHDTYVYLSQSHGVFPDNQMYKIIIEGWSGTTSKI